MILGFMGISQKGLNTAVYTAWLDSKSESCKREASLLFAGLVCLLSLVLGNICELINR